MKPLDRPLCKYVNLACFVGCAVLAGALYPDWPWLLYAFVSLLNGLCWLGRAPEERKARIKDNTE